MNDDTGGWQQLTVQCEPALALRVAELLELAEPTVMDVPAADSGRTDLRALFPAGQILTGLISVLHGLGECECALTGIPEQDWLAVSRDAWSPVALGDNVWMGPGWCAPPEAARLYLKIDPGQAFGTGQHPTTRLCLRWLIKNAADGLPATAIDYGCGSGALAISAAQLGVKKVLATDIDPLALAATTDNAAANAVASRVECIEPLVAARMPPAPLLLANILLRPLQALAPQLARLVTTDGRIVLSGILRSQVEACRDSYAAWFKFAPAEFEDDWALLVGQRRADS
ncbi:MAG: 50S ribosomal protein L11 methyltransferase [Gammaproteobacteria bacterium]